MFDDMPPLVDANPNMWSQQNIPPPAGAAFTMAGHPPPQNAFAGQGWNTSMPQPYPPFQATSQADWARWAQYCQSQGPPPALPMPSPYVPHLPMNPQTAQYDHFRKRSNSAPPAGPSNAPFNVEQQAAPWMWNAGPPIQTFPSTSSYPPASAVSMTQSLSTAYAPPDWPGERPRTWRRGFKFKSGISSLLFRRKSVSRLADAATDSARLRLDPILRDDKDVILDLRRSQHSLRIRELGRPVVANDLMQPCTNPPTVFMRLYHTRLPWYIDVVPSGNGSYVTLGDLFMNICQSLARPIHHDDYYNDELDADDREELKQTWQKRCSSKKERMEGVKQVDFLREKYMFLGLTRGKDGMWQLSTGKGYP